MTYQNLIVVGRLGKDPELKYLPSGQAVTTMSVATDRQYENAQGEKIKQTTWFRVSVWGKQAESCNQYLKKGKMVLVEGHLNGDESGNPRTFTRQDGSVGASYEVMAQTVRFLGGGGDEQSHEPAPAATSPDDFADF